MRFLICMLISGFYFLPSASAAPAAIPVLVNPSGVIVGPTNFFNLNSNRLRNALPVKGAAAGSGLVAATNNGVVTFSTYVSPQILTFVNNRNNVEIGSSVTSTLLDWTINSVTVTTQFLNQAIGVLPNAMRSTNHTDTYTTSRTYTLTVGDGTTDVTANSAVSFLHKRYWGVSVNTSLNDAQIIALSSELSATRVQSRSLSPSSQYLYFAYPASFGAASFTINGFADTAWTLVTRDFVNASGYTESFRIYRSNDTGIGTFIVGVN